jgi:para-aminobenzoate synthetase / 4-amino-4-deoxychorismate lyase
LRVAIIALPVDGADFRLRHKTTDRAFYDNARKAAPVDEVLFINSEGNLTEGSYTCIYFERDGQLLTPPVARGLLPSVLRRELIESGRAVEADLKPADLSGQFLLGNSLRGLIPARRVA